MGSLITKLLRKLPRDEEHCNLHDAILWRGAIDRTAVVTKNDNLFVCFRFYPHDQSIFSKEHRADADDRLNRALLRLSDRWTMWVEMARRQTTDYHSAQWPDAVSRMLDNQRRELFEKHGSQHDSFFYMTIQYSPDMTLTGQMSSLYSGDGAEDGASAKKALLNKSAAEFVEVAREIFCHLSSLTRGVEILSCHELATYLRSCASEEHQEVEMPPLGDMDSRYFLSDSFVGGYEPMLGKSHIRTVKIMSHPLKYHSGILDCLNAMGFPMRIVMRWQRLDDASARKELEIRRGLWNDTIGAWQENLSQAITGKKSQDKGNENLSARRNRDETNYAIALLDSEEVAFGYWVFTVTVWDRDLNIVKNRVAEIEKAIRNSFSFNCRVAKGIDAQQVWMGTIPGHLADREKLLTPTINIVKSMPWSAAWTGPDRDEYLNDAPIQRCFAPGASHFNLCLHQGGSSVGHQIVDGPTGTGKSFYLGQIIWGHRKYTGSRVVVIDYYASAKGITYALGGSYYDLSRNEGARLQPLALIDKKEERDWAFGWLVDYLEKAKVVVTPSRETEITLALDVLAEFAPKFRTITSFRALVQDEEIWKALATICVGGQAGHIFDNEDHFLGSGEDVLCFEMSTILETMKVAVEPALSAIYREIERGLDGRPVLLVIDEAQHFKRIPSFRRNFATRLETARKRRMAIILATPDLSAFTDDEEFAEIVKRGCQTKVFLGNSVAKQDDGSRVPYRRLGIPDAHIDVIANLRSDIWEAFFTTEAGSARFHFNATQIERDFVGRNSDIDKAAMDRVMAAGPRHEYAWRWMAYCGYSKEQIAELKAKAGYRDFMPALAAE